MRQERQMEKIIEPVDRELLMQELTPEKFLRHTNKSENEIYIVTHHDSPNTMLEIGRLREIAFRTAGGGTGKAVDIDEYDTMEQPYSQLIVWDPRQKEILGGYRFIVGSRAPLDEKGVPMLATTELFRLSPSFMQEYLPHTLELGRSFVTREYQSTQVVRKALFTLDNLWDGLGSLTVVMPEVKYFFGKVTMYPSYPTRARDMILYFLKKHFADKQQLVTPITPLKTNTPESELEQLFQVETFKEDYRILNKHVRELGYNIPPLVNAYMSLSPSMRVFGTAVNHEFGEVEETGILIAVNEILEEKIIRHIRSHIETDLKGKSYYYPTPGTQPKRPVDYSL